MSGALLGKGTWLGIALVALAGGAAAVRFLLPEPRIVVAGGTHDVVSRAAGSELEVSPTLASSKDGTLAVAWVAMTGGRDGGGRYVGVRVSAPSAGPLGPLVRLPSAANVSSPSVVPLGEDPHAFLVTWIADGRVMTSRVTAGGNPATPVPIAESAGRASNVRAAATPSGAVRVVVLAERGVSLWTTRDGAAFVSRELTNVTAGPMGVCADDRHVLVSWIDPSRNRTVVVANVPVEPEGPVLVAEASAPSEHVADTAPTCFVSGQEAFVVYGTTDKAEKPESVVADALVFARSKDDARTFWSRVTYRPPSHLLHPTLLHGPGSFTLLAVAGAGVGDAHASASLFVLNADGRSQMGLTRTVASPVTMVGSPDAAGYMGESLGVVEAAGATWAAVADNASGESHIALVRVL